MKDMIIELIGYSPALWIALSAAVLFSVLLGLMVRGRRRRKWKKAGRYTLPSCLPCHAWPALAAFYMPSEKTMVGIWLIVWCFGSLCIVGAAVFFFGVRKGMRAEINLDEPPCEEPPIPAQKRSAWRVRTEPVEDLPNILKLEIADAPGGCEHPVFGGARLYLEKHRSYFRVTGLYVPAVYRRRRMGSRLIAEVLDIAKSSALPIFVDAAPFGDAALDQDTLMRFYERLGFRRVPGHAYAMVQYSTRATEDPFASVGQDLDLPICAEDQQRILAACTVTARSIVDLLTANDGGLSEDDREDCIVEVKRQAGALQKALRDLKRRTAPKEVMA